MAETQSLVRLEELAARHGDRLYNYLYWLTGEPVAAESLAVQSFLRFAARYRRLVDNRRVAPLLYREATRLATDWQNRRAWASRFGFWRRETPASLPNSADGPAEGTVIAALRRLPQGSRALLLLREGEQMPFDEIAVVFGTSVGALRGKLFAARETMRRALGHAAGLTRECQPTWRLLSAMRDGALLSHEQNELKIHLEKCPACADRSQDYERLARQIQVFPRHTAPSHLHEQVFGTPTSLSLPLVVPSMGLVAIVMVALFAGALAVALGTAAWQSGFLAAVLDKPFAGPAAYIANAGEKGSIAVLATKGERVTKLVPVGAQPRSLAISPDGQSVYIAHDLGIGILDTRTNAITSTIQIPGGAQRVIADPKGRLLYVVDASRGRFPARLFVYEARTQLRLDTGVLGPDVYEAMLTADGRWIYAINGRDGTLTALDTQNSGRSQTIRLPQPGYEYVAVSSPDGRSVFVADRRRNLVTVVDPAGQLPLRTLSMGIVRDVPVSPSPPARPPLLAGGTAALSSDGKRLYVALLPAEEGLGVYNTDGFAETGRLKRKAAGVAVGADGLYISIAPEGVLLVADPITLQIRSTIPVGENPHSVVLKP